MQQGNSDILSTGEINQLSITEAEQSGIKLDILPFIRTETINDPGIKKEIISLVNSFIIVVFTSNKAVQALKEILKGIRPVWKIYCLQNSTTSLVQEYFGKDLVKGTASNARDLANLIVTNRETEIIFICGDQRRDELPDILKTEGVIVREITVYKTFQLPQKIKKNYGAILFYSPSAVESFFLNNTVDPDTKVFSIGNTTTEVLKKYTSNEIITGSSPDKHFLVQKAINYLKQTDGQSK